MHQGSINCCTCIPVGDPEESLHARARQDLIDDILLDWLGGMPRMMIHLYPNDFLPVPSHYHQD